MQGPTELFPRTISKSARRFGFLTVEATSSNNNNYTIITLPLGARKNSLIFKRRSTRINWGDDPWMEEAVDEWNNHRPNNDAGKPISLNQFASIKGIPKTAFQHYLHSEKSKRHKVGTSIGKKLILPEHNYELL